MPPEKIDSLADDVKPLVVRLLRQISGLTARVEELLTQNQALLARIAELEAKLGKPPKTPDNSSLPPSHGRKANAAEPTRGKKTRKGRPGAARALAENPDATRDIFAERCACGAALDTAGQERARSFDHIDLPPITPVVTRINLFRAICPCCKARVTATAPADMPEGSPFGPGIKAAVAYLHGCQMVGFKRLTELCQGLFGLTISQGAIANMLSRMGEPFGAAADKIAAIVRASEVIASDETSARVKGKTHCRWTFSPARGPKYGCRIACRRSAHTPRRISSASLISSAMLSTQSITATPSSLRLSRRSCRMPAQSGDGDPTSPTVPSRRIGAASTANSIAC